MLSLSRSHPKTASLFRFYVNPSVFRPMLNSISVADPDLVLRGVGGGAVFLSV